MRKTDRLRGTALKDRRSGRARNSAKPNPSFSASVHSDLMSRTDVAPSSGPTRGVGASSWKQSLFVALLAAITLLATFPLASAAYRTIRWATSAHTAGPGHAGTSDYTSVQLVLRTVGYVSVIAMLAAALAIPAAWLLSRVRRSNRWVAALTAVPLFMPSYLAYAGWGLLRAPRSTLGDWLSSGSNAAVEWKFLIANHFFAVWGLALWSYPIAAFTMALFFRRITRDLLDALTLDRAPAAGADVRGIGASAWVGVIVRLAAPGFLVASGLVSLVMLGSVVPLDVAQVNTYSIHLLRFVTERQVIEEAWASAWPVYLIAIVAAWLLLRRCGGSTGGANVAAGGAMGATGGIGGVGGDATENVAPMGSRPRLVHRLLVASAGVIWVFAVIVPVVLFVLHMREGGAGGWERVAQLSAAFWRESRTGVLVSARVASVVALAGTAIAIGAWLIVSGGLATRRQGAVMLVLRVLTLLFLIAGLLPGVFVGSATAQAWTALSPHVRVRPSWLLVALAHLARFGFIAMVVGWWLARQEPAAVRDLRRVDGAVSGRGWLGAVFAARWPFVLGVSAAMFALSFHEIEATVQVQPPGPQALSQQLLNSLHFARDDYLASAVVNLLALTGVLGVVAGWVWPGRSLERG